MRGRRVYRASLPTLGIWTWLDVRWTGRGRGIGMVAALVSMLFRRVRHLLMQAWCRLSLCVASASAMVWWLEGLVRPLSSLTEATLPISPAMSGAAMLRNVSILYLCVALVDRLPGLPSRRYCL